MITDMATHKTPPRKLIYEGKAKKLFEGPDAGTVIVHFKDDATAFNNQKKGIISGKGVINNKISEYLMVRLTEIGVPNHFIRTLNMREQLCKAVEIVPLEVIVRNIAAGSLSKRFGISEGQYLPYPLVEYCFKSDKLEDPMVSPEHIVLFDWADPIELEDIANMALRINDYLSGLFMGVGLRLVDFKVEFGRLYDGNMVQIVLADEISPDSCRLWDEMTGEKMDKDRFRRDLGNVEEAYREVARRLGVLPEESSKDKVINVFGGGAKPRKPVKALKSIKLKKAPPPAPKKK